MVDRAIHDLRYALRSFRQSPGLTLTIIVSVGLGVGISTAVFSLADRILLRPLPAVTASEDVVSVRGRVSLPLYRDIAAAEGVFTDVAAYSMRDMARAAPEGTVPVRAGVVSGNYFGMLGVGSALGRTLQESDDDRGAPTAVMLSHRLWRSEFGGRANVLGEELLLNGRTFTVAGVTPAGFRGLMLGIDPDVWVTIEGWGLARTGELATLDLDGRGWSWLTMVGRLQPGSGATAAASWLHGQWTAVHEATGGPQPPASLDVVAARAAALGLDGEGQVRLFVKLLLVVVLLALLIACANVANLLVARASRREGELALRTALGAGRGHVAGQLMTESALLGVAGTLAAVLVAVWATDLLSAAQLPGQLDVAALGLVLDQRALAFGVALGVMTTVAFGVLPALRASQVQPASVLARRMSDDAGSARVRTSLVVFQMTLCVVLLAGAGLFGRTLSNAFSADLGFERRGLFGIHASLGSAGYDAASAATYLQQVRARATAAPGVEHAAWAAFAPMSDFDDVTTFSVAGAPTSQPTPRASYNVVGVGYFETVGIPIVAGRGFVVEEMRAEQEAVIVNEAFVREWLRDVDPVGRVLTAGGTDYQIVGVARDAKYADIAEAPRPYLYFSAIEAIAVDGLELLVRAEGREAAAMAAATAALRSIDNTVPLRVRSVDERIGAALAPQRTLVMLLGLLGGLTLVLALTGTYGVVAYTVSRRRREFGIRLALGARNTQLLRMVLRQAAAPIAAGIAVGVLAAAFASRAVASLLYGVAPGDAVTLAAVAAFLGIGALAAAAGPAWRASRTNPAITLRE